MSEPRTEAGRHLLSELPDDAGAYDGTPIRDHILAIETEARGEWFVLDVRRLARALWEDDDHSLGGPESYLAEAKRIANEYAVADPLRLMRRECQEGNHGKMTVRKGPARQLESWLSPYISTSLMLSVLNLVGQIEKDARSVPEAEQVMQAWDGWLGSGQLVSPAWNVLAEAVEALRAALVCGMCQHPVALHDNPGRECLAEGCECDRVP